MSDRSLLARLEALVGQPFPCRLEGDRCVELALTSDAHLVHGLIRHHTPAQKQDVLRLVSQLTGLRRLDLRRNCLGQLVPELAQLTELEHLNLGSNYLGRVPVELQSFPRLRHLQLGNNDLTELPGFLGEYPDLEYLALHKNVHLKSIESLAPLRRLRTLNLYFVNLNVLPGFLYEFVELRSIALWNVSRFPQGIAPLRNLEFFTLCGTPGLRGLPAGFTSLAKLRMTRLFQNNLESLPEDISQLSQLEQISVYQNQLASLPDSFGDLTRMEKVNLGWNRFTRVPDCLRRLPNLKWIALFENPLTEPVPAFPSATRVCIEWPFSTVHAAA